VESDTVIRLPGGSAVERVRRRVGSNFDSLVGFEVPGLVNVHVFPEPSPPVTAVDVSFSEFLVTFVHHVAAVDSDHVSGATTAVLDGPQVETVDTSNFDLEVRVVDFEVRALGVEFNTVELHGSPARVHIAFHTANPDDLLCVSLGGKCLLACVALDLDSGRAGADRGDL